ncbi:MAG: DUF5947 family protein [Pseudonocardiaceae bacterium]
MSADPPRPFGIPPLPPEGLQRFLRPPPPKPRPGELCEMCLEPIPPEGAREHGHVVDLDARNVMCACRACYLLFEHKGAARGRYRAVPDRYRHDPEFALGEGQWDALQVPVAMAFFFFNSDSDVQRVVCFYPSPAGATESLLPLDTWDEVMAANPAFGDATPDVEALLIYRPKGQAFECFLVPITACYELVGRVRLRWKGFDGGTEVWAEIDAFFDRLRGRSERVKHEDGGGGMSEELASRRRPE